MYPAIIISAFTSIIMIMGVLFFPTVRVFGVRVSSYWLITFLGALILILSGETDVESVLAALTADTAINPLKILTLFICMTVLSIYLDELGFFRYLAYKVLKRAHTGQRRLFFALYLIVSVLTIFTSNDIIILSFTPFICYFARSAKIDPTPYLAAEFVAANTWSMALVIGNPTNIYLASAFDVGFIDYLKVSALPTVMAGAVALFALYLMFSKKLKAPIEGEPHKVVLKDKTQLVIGVAHLAVCTVLIAISSYVHIEMWIVSLASVASLSLFALVVAAKRREHPEQLVCCFRRAPIALIPFVLSMFVIILTLSEKGVTAKLCELLSGKYNILTYGTSSFLFANIINNIPMSVLYSSIISNMTSGALGAVFATIVGSNIGAFLTPIGALAGIMWTSILNSHGVKFSYLNFLKLGVFIAIPTLFAALAGLYIVI